MSYSRARVSHLPSFLSSSFLFLIICLARLFFSLRASLFSVVFSHAFQSLSIFLFLFILFLACNYSYFSVPDFFAIFYFFVFFILFSILSILFSIFFVLLSCFCEFFMYISFRIEDFFFLLSLIKSYFNFNF